jgi:hypothetical protein
VVDNQAIDYRSIQYHDPPGTRRQSDRLSRLPQALAAIDRNRSRETPLTRDVADSQQQLDNLPSAEVEWEMPGELGG